MAAFGPPPGQPAPPSKDSRNSVQTMGSTSGIHNQVGLILQAESERVGLTDARLNASAFGRIVAARLRAEGYEGKTLRALERQIIEAATHRLVFLVGIEADRVGFE